MIGTRYIGSDLRIAAIAAIYLQDEDGSDLFLLTAQRRAVGHRKRQE